MPVFGPQYAGDVIVGIATVRIDKRGMFASSAAVADANSVTLEDYAADVDAWASVILKELAARVK